MRAPSRPSVWPPELPEDKLEALADESVCYALAHGLLFLPPNPTTGTKIPALAQHAPFSLFPSLFSRRLFDLAKRLQHTYNVLYARVAMDTAFLDSVMGEETGVGRVDPFIGCLWRIWKDNREEGIVQVRCVSYCIYPTHAGSEMQGLQLGIFRSDYMVHASDLTRSSTLKQVEFNTIAASGGVHSNMTLAMHKSVCFVNDHLGLRENLMLGSRSFVQIHAPVDAVSGIILGLRH